jgi:hypothetical protein
MRAASRSQARSGFARSDTEIVGSNPTGAVDVCVRSFCVRVAASRRADPPPKESYRLCIGLGKVIRAQGPTKGLCSLVKEGERQRWKPNLCSRKAWTLNKFTDTVTWNFPLTKTNLSLTDCLYAAHTKTMRPHKALNLVAIIKRIEFHFIDINRLIIVTCQR